MSLTTPVQASAAARRIATSDRPAADAGDAFLRPGSHIPALDGLRGVAVLAVMLCHFTTKGLPDTVTGNLVGGVFDAGWSGVDLFFVLSGFLITGILYDAKGAPNYFRSFYARRILRIFPLYYGSLAVFFWLVPAVHPFTPAIERAAERQEWLWGYASNLLMAREGRWVFAADWMEFGHFWTLAIEEQFYLFWPIIVFLLSRKALMRVCIACMLVAFVIRVALVARGAPSITVGMLTVCRFDALAVGALVALALRGNSSRIFAHARLASVLCGAAILALASWRREWDAADPVVQTVGFTLLGLFFAGILVLALGTGRDNALARRLSHPLLIWFGTYSYAMYVFHVALMPVFTRVMPVEGASARLGSPYLGVAAYTAFSIAATATTSYTSWHLYEKHFLRLKKHFVLRRAMPPSRAAAGEVATPQVALAIPAERQSAQT